MQEKESANGSSRDYQEAPATLQRQRYSQTSDYDFERKTRKYRAMAAVRRLNRQMHPETAGPPSEQDESDSDQDCGANVNASRMEGEEFSFPEQESSEGASNFNLAALNSFGDIEEEL